MTTTPQSEALDRLKKYITERKRLRQTDVNLIHGLHGGDDDREATLYLSDIEAVIQALSAVAGEPVAQATTYSQAEFDEAYEVGNRDGYESAVQDIDLLTGGDGEYRYCIGGDPDRHTPDAETMKSRIADRFNALTSPAASHLPSREALIEAAKRVDFVLSEGCIKGLMNTAQDSAWLTKFRETMIALRTATKEAEGLRTGGGEG